MQACRALPWRRQKRGSFSLPAEASWHTGHKLDGREGKSNKSAWMERENSGGENKRSTSKPQAAAV
jgi:hypothetical protein